MEFIALLLIFVILLVLLTHKSNVSSKFSALEDKIEDLTLIIKRMSLEQSSDSKKEVQKPIEQVVQHRPPQPVPEKPAEPAFRKPEVTPPPPPKPQPLRNPVPGVEQMPWRKEDVEKVQPQKFTPAKTFFEVNPDLEKFIGENLANKIGIAILVVGIGFFVKYAIDKNWIGEIGRVFIGVLCGGILLGVAHKLRKTFIAFSSVLVGGGIAVLYFTIAIAFHEYGIFNQTAAFIIMVGITAFTVVLALSYNRIELAVFAILGGFGSPFMVSTGAGNYVVLFTYMLILNSGMLVLAYYKKWRLLNIICYISTILIYGGWLSSRFDPNDALMIQGALIFATLFYVVFFAMNIINNLREKANFEAMEILMLLSNTFFYYTAGMIILNNPIGSPFRGLFTAMLGVFNFIFAFALYRNKRVDRNLVFLLIGLVLTFISLAAPIQLEGNYITLFWAAEAVLLLWLSQKSGITLMRVASVIVLVLMCFSLMIDWKQIYGVHTEMKIILNKGFITSLAGVASLILTGLLLTNESKDDQLIKSYRMIITVIAVAFIYVANLLELRHHLVDFVDSFAARSVIIGTYNMFFILVLLLAEGKLNVPDEFKRLFPMFGLIAMGAYLFYYHGMIVDSRNEYIDGLSTPSGFIFHYLLIILLVVSSILSLVRINALREYTELFNDFHWWIYVVFFVFVASAELDHTVVLTLYSGEGSTEWLLDHNHKIGFPILWGISAFLLIAVGLKRKIKMLRIISLVLLLVTLFKLFFIDLKGISEGGKIAAFISLGILLLVVSFMYQRLKKLLLEDSSEETKEVV